METIGLKEWANTPLEYKVGDVRGHPGHARIPRNNPEAGGTELVPVRFVPDQVLEAWRADHPGLEVPDGEWVEAWGRGNAGFVARYSRRPVR